MATILPLAKTQFVDSNGIPIALGSVYFYVPGTLTPKDTYQDINSTILNTNPVILDAAGRALIWGSGAYRQIVKDVLGNTIWDQETSDIIGGAISSLTTAVASLADLQALNVTSGALSPIATNAYRTTAGDGGGGTWAWLSGDQSALVSSDPQHGIYAPPTSDLSGASGCWERLFGGPAYLPWWGATPSATDNSAAIQAAVDAFAGEIIVPEQTFNITNVIAMRNNAVLVGISRKSRIVNTNTTGGVGQQAQNCLLFGSHTLTSIGSYTYYPLNNIAAGDRTVTCTTASDASHFSALPIAFVSSTTLDSGVPIWSQFNRVLSYNATTGVLTLEHPIKESVTGVHIAVIDGVSSGGPIACYVSDGCGARGLSLYSQNGKAFDVEAMYEGVIEDVWIEKSRFLLNGNGMCFSTYRNIEGFFDIGFLETDVSSYDFKITGLRGYYSGATPDRTYLLRLGEYSHHALVEDFEVNANGWNGSAGTTYALLFDRTCVGCRVARGKMWVESPTELVSVINGTQIAASNNSIDDVEIHSVAPGYFLVTGADSGGTIAATDLSIKNLRCYGTPTTYAILVQGAISNFELTESFFEHGEFIYSPTSGSAWGGAKLHGNSIESWGGFSKLNAQFSGNKRIGCDPVYAAAFDTYVVSVNSTTANNPIDTFAFAAVPTLTLGDRFEFKVYGQITGTTDIKHLRLVDTITSTTILSIDVAAGSTGYFDIEGAIVVESVTANTYLADINYIAPGTVQSFYNALYTSGVNFPVNGGSFQWQAWVNNAADTIIVREAKMKARFYGE